MRSFLRKLRAFTGTYYAWMLAYRAEIYLWVLAHVLPFIMMGVWAKAAQTGNFSMSDPADYARYFFAVFCIRQFSAVWMIYDFEYQVVEGRLTYHLLRPATPVWYFVSVHIGEQLARLPFFVIMSALFFVLYPDALWLPTPFSVIGGIIAIYLAFALRFIMQWCVAMLTFWYERSGSLDQLVFLPYMFLSGLIAPLAEFPPQVAAIARLTPFPYLIDFPARIITGKITPTSPELYQGLGVFTAWFVILFVIANVSWKRGLRHYSGHGA